MPVVAVLVMIDSFGTSLKPASPTSTNEGGRLCGCGRPAKGTGAPLRVPRTARQKGSHAPRNSGKEKTAAHCWARLLRLWYRTSTSDNCVFQLLAPSRWMGLARIMAHHPLAVQALRESQQSNTPFPPASRAQAAINYIAPATPAPHRQSSPP